MAQFEVRVTEGSNEYRLFETSTGNEIEGLRSIEKKVDTIAVSSQSGESREIEIFVGYQLEGRMSNGIEWQLEIDKVDLVMVPAP